MTVFKLQRYGHRKWNVVVTPFYQLPSKFVPSVQGRPCLNIPRMPLDFAKKLEKPLYGIINWCSSKVRLLSFHLNVTLVTEQFHPREYCSQGTLKDNAAKPPCTNYPVNAFVLGRRDGVEVFACLCAVCNPLIPGERKHTCQNSRSCQTVGVSMRRTSWFL